MNHRRRIVTSTLLLTAACATPVEIDRPEHVLEAELRTFQMAQRVFREQNIAPFVFDFPGHGRVTLRDISLDGFPGGAYVRCRFDYQNRTEKPVVQSWVSLDVLDSDGKLVASQACVCIVPIPIPIARGCYYSDELRTKTFDAHLKPGWSWRIRCTAQLQKEDDLLDPPVPEYIMLQPTPVTIKDRR